MQYKLTRKLNTVFVIFAVIILIIWAIYFVSIRNYNNFQSYYIYTAAVVSALFVIFFLWLEQNLDKRVITRMAKNGEIALANIKSAKRLRFMRDSNFNQYWLYEFEADIFDKSHNKREIKFCDKLSFVMEEIPKGSVFVTYKDNDADSISIIPNALIGFLPQLKDAVSGYENDKRVNIKYLDVFYKKGLVLRTYDEAMKRRYEV